MSKAKRYYYVYKIEFETGQFYIGSRTSKVLPERDTGYWGSPITHKHLWEDKTLKKTKHIIKICETDDEKRELEIKLIREAWDKYPNLSLNETATYGCPTEILSENGKRHYENRTGIFSLTEEEMIEVRKKAGKNSVEKHKELGIGLFGLTPEQRKETGRKVGNKLKEQGIGLFGRTPEQIYECAKKAAKASAEKKSKEFTFRSPEGKIVTGKNLRKFCRENNLYSSAMISVKQGKQSHHKGWTLP